MVFTSLLIPPLTFALILMLIRSGILLTAALLVAVVSFWGTLLFPGIVRNNILYLALALRQSIVLWLILPLNFLLFASCWKIWVLHIFHRLSYIVTTVVLFRLHIIIFSMSAPSILRLMENYIILREYTKCVLPPLTEVVGPTMNLISGTHHFCERKEYAFNILLEYDIIIQDWLSSCASSSVRWHLMSSSS